jgi:hypothetical protein
MDAVPRYSALYTCNTWAADTLRSAGLPVRSTMTLLAGQLWRQVTRLAADPRLRAAAPGLVADPRFAARADQSQGGGLPFWQTTAVLLP